MKQGNLFKTEIVPAGKGSENLFEEQYVSSNNPVKCLGMTFENDEERRNYFIEVMRCEKKGANHSQLTTNHYHREPFAADASEKKNDAIYNAHSYYTKVSHKAINFSWEIAA